MGAEGVELVRAAEGRGLIELMMKRFGGAGDQPPVRMGVRSLSPDPPSRPPPPHAWASSRSLPPLIACSSFGQLGATAARSPPESRPPQCLEHNQVTNILAGAPLRQAVSG